MTYSDGTCERCLSQPCRCVQNRTSRRARPPRRPESIDQRQYDSTRHEDGLRVFEPAFADRMLQFGVVVVRADPAIVRLPDHDGDRWDRFNWQVGRTFIDSKGRNNLFDDKGRLQHRTLVVPASKMEFAEQHPDLRFAIVWHSDDLKYVRWIAHLPEIKKYSWVSLMSDGRDWNKKAPVWNVMPSLTGKSWRTLAAALLQGAPLVDAPLVR